MKLKDIADCIITGVLTRRVVYAGEDNDSSLKEGKILVPKAIDDGLIDHSLLQRVKLDKEVKDKFYTKKGDVIMKLSTPYDSCFIDREEDEGLIVPSFSLIIRGLKSDYDPYFIMAFLSSRYAWNQIERLRSGRTITILSNESVAELDIPEFKKLERERISERYKNYLEFKRMSSEIIELEKERNDVMFFSKEASV